MLLLYSTNVYLKFLIHQEFYGNLHYVWCSENFDAKTVSRYALGSLVPPSSNPADIFREIKRDVLGHDQHSAKITQQKATLKSLAVQFAANGRISSTDRDEIVYLVDNSPFDYWRPLIYVIPRVPVESRLELVDPARRAGCGKEYVIPDLKTTEFDVIEP